MSDIIDEEENVQEEVEYALPGKRIFVALIDVINCWILSYIISFLYPSAYDHSIYSISILVMTVYKILSEKIGFQTFGKMMYKLDVLTKDQKKPGWSHVLRRNSIWILLLIAYAVYYYMLIPSYAVQLSSIPFIYSFLNLSYILRCAALIILIDMGFVFLTASRQSLHDMLGETIVVDRT